MTSAEGSNNKVDTQSQAGDNQQQGVTNAPPPVENRKPVVEVKPREAAKPVSSVAAPTAAQRYVLFIQELLTGVRSSLFRNKTSFFEQQAKVQVQVHYFKFRYSLVVVCS